MPEYKGRVNGIILACFSIGSLMFNTIISAVCNPNVENPINLNGETYYTGDVADNFPGMLRVLSVIFGVMGTLGIILCFRKTESNNEHKPSG